MPQSTPSFDEIRSILKEISLSQKEADRRMQETDRRMQERMQETDRRMQERMQEADQLRKEADQLRKETDQQIKKTSREVDRTSREIRQLKDMFSNKWGEFVESLVSGRLLTLLKERNIKVTGIFPNMRAHIQKPGEPIKHCEIDIIARNSHELVAVEVKSTLGAKEVDHFLKTLQQFTLFFPEYKDKKIYGAVAYLKLYQSADIYAMRKGLFVIRATGDSARIVNDDNFKPVDFSSVS